MFLTFLSICNVRAVHVAIGITRSMSKKIYQLEPSGPDISPNKRERTRAQLVRAAFAVYARKGFDAPSIDDFIAEAGVSRGTFYNYFQTREDLMAAVAADLATFINAHTGRAMEGIADPLERITIAVRYFVTLAVENETRAWVLARMIPIVGGPLTLAMSQRARADIEAAAATGRIRPRSIAASVDLGLGMMAMAIRHNLSRRAAPYSAELVAGMVLQSMGSSVSEAEEVSNRPLPRVVPDSSSDISWRPVGSASARQSRANKR
jgi:AcrR family transcriptional regulator